MLISRYEVLSALALPVGLALTLNAPPAAESSHETLLPAPYQAEVSFKDDVAPIFDEFCIECHGSEAEADVIIEAGLRLTSYENLMKGSEFGSVVEPGDADGSMLMVLIEDGDMPEDGDPLTKEQIETIRTWIAEGAKNN